MVSIIIPFYNVIQFLHRSVTSVLSQTYQDIELVLVDDGSSDGSAALCDELALADARIRVVHQTNAGASVARRVGISASKGEYVAFVDADDVVEPDYIERLYHALSEHHAMIAACDFIVHREDEPASIVRTEDSRVLDDKELHDRFFKYDFWGFCGKIYYREVFDEIYFPDATVNEDYVVMAQLFDRYKQMAYVPVPLYHYIKHEGSLSNQQISMRAMDEYYNKRWVLEYYELGMRSEEFGIRNELKRCAEAQLTETCIKLLRMIREAGRPQAFAGVYCEMRAFLRSHLFAILRNPHLLIGLKVMAVKSLL